MRRTIVIVLGLAVVLLGLDVGARTAAETAVATRVKASQGLSQQPDVQVHGFPFLTQALSGRYQQVDVRMRGVAVGNELALERLDARLTGVHLPPSALLRSTGTSIPVDQVHLTGTASFAALNVAVASAVPADLATLHFSDGGDGQVKVTARYRVLGAPMTLTGRAMVSLSDGTLRMSLSRDTLAQLPSALRGTVSEWLSRSVPLQRLPLGLVADRLSVHPDGITVTADASHVTLPAG